MLAAPCERILTATLSPDLHVIAFSRSPINQVVLKFGEMDTGGRGGQGRSLCGIGRRTGDGVAQARPGRDDGAQHGHRGSAVLVCARLLSSLWGPTCLAAWSGRYGVPDQSRLIKYSPRWRPSGSKMLCCTGL